MGIDYNFNECNIFIVALFYCIGEDDNCVIVIFCDFDLVGNLFNIIVCCIEEVEEEYNLEVIFNYEWQYDNFDQKWIFNFKYILDDDIELADYWQMDEELIMLFLQCFSNIEDEINMLLQIDYIYFISESIKVEGGLWVVFCIVNNDFFVEEEGVDGVYMFLFDFNDELEYMEDIYVVYVIGGYEFGLYSVQVGLCVEFFDIIVVLF